MATCQINNGLALWHISPGAVSWSAASLVDRVLSETAMKLCLLHDAARPVETKQGVYVCYALLVEQNIARRG